LKPLVFLDRSEPFSAQVAAHLLSGCSEPPRDISGTLVIVPTAGAARAIRRQLAQQSPCGVLSPEFCLPLQAILPEEITVATSVERLAALIQVLQDIPRSKFVSLVPLAVKLAAPEDWIGVASRLLAVSDALAEAGFNPSDYRLVEFCPHDAVRWAEFGQIHTAYEKLLHAAGRPDPNMVRIAQASGPTIPPAFTKIVVASVPDLPIITAEWLVTLEKQGVIVEILCAPAAHDEAQFDVWGRPDPLWWSTHPVAITDELLVIANDAAGEVAALLDFAAGQGGNSFALVSAAPETTIALEAEIARRDALPYLPQGRPLRQTEAATILDGWNDFLRTGRLRLLRPLLQLPVFLRLLIHGTDLASHEPAAACDLLLAEKLCENVASARDWTKHNLPDRPETQLLHRFIAALDAFAATRLEGHALLAKIYAGEKSVNPSTTAELEVLVATLDESSSSPLLSGLPATWREALHRNEIATRQVFTPAPEDAVEILGWLEALWTDAPVICVSGCREGALPAGVAEDAFLPDAARTALGLSSQTTRMARDAYLLSCLVRARGAGSLRLGFSRFRPEGEPNRPSRLLFGCPDVELPARIEKVFHPSISARPIIASAPWPLRLAKAGPVTSIRVTGFKHYLECPLRFYLGQVMKLQPFDPDQREIGAADYGTLLHRVLENFHKTGPHDSTDEKIIAAWLDQELNRVIAKHYGRHPAPVIRVQTESMRVRLRHLAAVQAAERRDGWRIIESEYAVKKEHGYTIGPLTLTGTMDRVEIHEERGLRILDYKTFARTQTPEDTHFGSPREHMDLPEAAISRPDKRGSLIEKSWIDLQLPLYRRLAAAVWPGPAERGLAAGYLLLPGSPDDTQIALLSLDESAQSDAECCADAVAERIAQGVFWPPAERVKYDNFSDWFGNEDPRTIFDHETIANLEGRE